jgi:flagellar hook-basal body complex protein FliE
MSIAPISGAGAAFAPMPVKPSGPSSGFGDKLTSALQKVSDAENRADDLLTKLARGEDVELHQVTIATTEAALSVQMMVAIRDQAVQAYSEIMNMQF